MSVMLTLAPEFSCPARFVAAGGLLSEIKTKPTRGPMHMREW